MDANTYQELVERTKSASKDSFHERIGLSAAGIAGEAAELVEVFRGAALYGDLGSMDLSKILKEAGDLCWYIAHLLTTVDLPFAPVIAEAEKLPVAWDAPLVEVTLDLLIDAGKLADYLKKVAYHRIEIDKSKLQARLFPVWCGVRRLLACSLYTPEQAFDDNIAKLRARYPQGFTTADSLARKDGEQME